MTFKLGLTGSIGMGKSTTAAMFADLGCVVWDADAAVSRLYAADGAALPQLRDLVPEAISSLGVDRAALRKALRNDPTLFAKLESIVHPLVRADRTAFLEECASDIVVFDIPLLFETGAEEEMDATACVSTSPHHQRARVLARGTMSESDLDAILDKQMPNEEKCRRATYVIATDTLQQARDQVSDIVEQIRVRQENA